MEFSGIERAANRVLRMFSVVATAFALNACSAAVDSAELGATDDALKGGIPANGKDKADKGKGNEDADGGAKVKGPKDKADKEKPEKADKTKPTQGPKADAGVDVDVDDADDEDDSASEEGI